MSFHFTASISTRKRCSKPIKRIGIPLLSKVRIRRGHAQNTSGKNPLWHHRCGSGFGSGSTVVRHVRLTTGVAELLVIVQNGKIEIGEGPPMNGHSGLHNREGHERHCHEEGPSQFDVVASSPIRVVAPNSAKQPLAPIEDSSQEYSKGR